MALDHVAPQDHLAADDRRRRFGRRAYSGAAGVPTRPTAHLHVDGARWFAAVSLASIHPKFKTPHVTTILTGVFVGGIAAFANIESMLNLTNVGTLFAFLLVCIGIPILRRKDPAAAATIPRAVWRLPDAVAGRGIVHFSHVLPGCRYVVALHWLAGARAFGLPGLRIHAQRHRHENGPAGKDAGALKIAALGFFALAIGLFTVPHHIGFFLYSKHFELGERTSQSLAVWRVVYRDRAAAGNRRPGDGEGWSNSITRNQTMNALPIIIGALCVIAISYRYYSAFIAAKVLALDDSRPVPSQTMFDGHNYYPTNKWVLFGHHFAAISPGR